MGSVFAVLTAVSPCNAGGPWWRKPDLLTDLCYFFLLPLMTGYLGVGLLVIGGMVATGSVSKEAVQTYFEQGHGPLAHLSFWPQTIFYLLAFDLLTYWTHRAFHTMSLWRYHAVHHSSEHLEWVSAYRFHPVNTLFHSVFADTVLLVLGVAPGVLIYMSPFILGASVLVHANLNWTFGPFRYVLASPVFHRWHHTAAERGGSKNFAATFPFIDVLFGTFYMPDGVSPDCYGVHDQHAFPKNFLGQMGYPFKGLWRRSTRRAGRLRSSSPLRWVRPAAR